MLFVMPFIVAMVVTMAWMPVFAKLASRWRVVDHPGARKVHAAPIPRIGGLAMAIGVLIAALLSIPLGSHERYFLLAAAVLTVFGYLDDRFDLDPRIKFLGQFIAAGIVILGGDIQIHSVTLDDRVFLPAWISVPLTYFFLVGITNAINLVDGLDGLAGGTTFLCLCALAILAYHSGQVSCAALALAFAGAILGFLRFNTFPASIFMGDAGSQLLGFAVGVLSLRATQSGNSMISAAIPVLLLALPILDTLNVMTQRISEGRSPFSADKNHIHHKLLSFGFDHHEAVMVIYAIQADLFLLAYWMRYESDLTILAVVSLFFVGTIMLLQVATRRRWRFRSARTAAQDSPLVRMIKTLRQPQGLPRWSYAIIGVAIWGYALIVIAETANVSRDVRLLLVALLAVAAAGFAALRQRPLITVEKAVLYTTGAVLVYLDSSSVQGGPSLHAAAWVAILVMAVGTLVRLQFCGDRRFVLTPLDLLVLFVALVVPSLPDTLGLPDGGALGIAKLVVLFYAMEVLVNRLDLPVLWLRIIASTLLVSLVARSLL
jgi:UDP-GlcNAc:undecaprenyl-phosphate GlcNAc-1-phosphate transferase